MNGILLPAYVENVSSRKDRSVKIVLGTQELTPQQAGEIFNLLNNLVVTYISVKDISAKEIEMVDKIDAELGGKTQSQRIRAHLYKLYEMDNQGYKDFNQFYHAETDKYINHLKNKLDQ